MKPPASTYSRNVKTVGSRCLSASCTSGARASSRLKPATTTSDSPRSKRMKGVDGPRRLTLESRGSRSFSTARPPGRWNVFWIGSQVKASQTPWRDAERGSGRSWVVAGVVTQVTGSQQGRKSHPPRRRRRRLMSNPIALHGLTLTRRGLLRRSVSAAALAALGSTAPSLSRVASAQSPKRGGTLTLRLWDPPHWDPYLIIAFKTQIPYSYTHSRLLRHKAGPSTAPGTFVLEGDLAESWSQPDDTTYIFKLRRGMRFHPKPPVNGRELTAEDVVYSMERFRTVSGNPQAYMLAALDKVEALDRYTVKFTVKEPFAWFLNMLANPVTLAIVARECVEKFGDLKKPEAVVGTGPWMLDSYRPNVGYTLVRNPNYFLAGLPYIDRIEVFVDEDYGSRIAAFLGGKYDLGWEFPGSINRTDWVQIKEQLKRRRPGLQTVEYPTNVATKVIMRTDRAPYSDVRVRRAMSHALNRQGLIEAVLEGGGVTNGAVPAALKEWALPVDQLGEGSRYYKFDPVEARRLLAEAGYPRGFSTVLDFHNFGSTALVDAMQLVVKDFKDVGIEVKLNQKE